MYAAYSLIYCLCTQHTVWFTVYVRSIQSDVLFMYAAYSLIYCLCTQHTVWFTVYVRNIQSDLLIAESENLEWAFPLIYTNKNEIISPCFSLMSRDGDDSGGGGRPPPFIELGTSCKLILTSASTEDPMIITGWESEQHPKSSL